MAAKKSGGKKATGGGTAAKSGNTQDNLKAAAGVWKSTPAPEPGSFGDIPDGKYQAAIEEAVIENGGKNRDKLQIKWSFRISGPSHAKRMVWMNTGLADDKGVEYSKKAIQTLGLALPDEIEKLPDVLAQAVGAAVELALITKPGKNAQGVEQMYQNTYMNKRLDVEVNKGPAEAASTTESVSFMGQSVEFDDGTGTKVRGKVVLHNGDEVTVQDAKGEDWGMTVADITIVNEPPPPPPANTTAPAGGADGKDLVGKTVEFLDADNRKMTGVATALDAEGNLTVKVGEEEWGVPAAECTAVEAPKGPVKKGPIKKTK